MYTAHERERERERGFMRVFCLPRSTMAYNIVFVASFFLLRFNFSEAQMVPAMFVFGDSLVDVGNNNFLDLSVAKATLPYYGIDLPTKKPAGRFTNGMNAADFLAKKVGLPTSPPYLSLVNEFSKNKMSFLTGASFASGGARILDRTDPYAFQSVHLTQQVDYFSTVYEDLYIQLGSSGAERLLSKAIFAIVIGNNDILGYFRSSDLRNETTPRQYVDSMVLTLEAKLKYLYNRGARKFVITGIATLGCCPARRSETKNEECNEEMNYWSVKYNEGLVSMLHELKSDLKDLYYSYFDSYKVLLNFIQNPAAYGFVEVKAACCGLGTLDAEIFCLPIANYCSNRSDHVFFDRVHPTEATYRIFVDHIFDGSSQYTFPMNMRQLVAI
ncbi:GDSL esterase/lipase At5g55050-like [Carya illinoinensis]|nr:GDSL esterase/lipase At5g55050-like [Carya illinoinensis]